MDNNTVADKRHSGPTEVNERITDYRNPRPRVNHEHDQIMMSIMMVLYCRLCDLLKMDIDSLLLLAVPEQCISS